MNEIQINNKERLNKHLSKQNLNKAVEAIQEDGYVIIHDIIEQSNILALRARMMTDINKILSLDIASINSKKVIYNKIRHHLDLFYFEIYW